MHADESKAGLMGNWEARRLSGASEWYSRRRCWDMKVVPSQEGGADEGVTVVSGMMKNGRSKGPEGISYGSDAVERFRWRWECGRFLDTKPLPVPYALTFNPLIVLCSS